MEVLQHILVSCKFLFLLFLDLLDHSKEFNDIVYFEFIWLFVWHFMTKYKLQTAVIKPQKYGFFKYIGIFLQNTCSISKPSKTNPILYGLDGFLM